MTAESQARALVLPMERPRPPMPVAQVNSPGDLLSVIARVASDPATNIENLERLMAMHERMAAKSAEAQFNEALASMQAELPIITKTGEIKNKAGGVQSKYALWEDINKAILPHLQQHGFSLSFRAECPEGFVVVHGVLAHKAGHSTTTSIRLPHDVSGAKNAVQAVASSVSYGKRYTAGMLLNITSGGEDDDAQTTGYKAISEEQVATLHALIEDVGADKRRFLAHLKVASLEEIPAANYEAVVGLLNQKRRAGGAR